MKKFSKLAGKGPKARESRDPEQEAARALEAARRETAERLGGTRMDPAAGAPSFGAGREAGPSPQQHAPPARPTPPAHAPPPSSRSAPPPPSTPQPSAPRDFLGSAPPPASAGPGSFSTPNLGGGATPSDERRAITDMALEDLQRQRQAAAAESPAVVRPARIPEDEYERRRPPAPGESLPGVPPPHIPSEDLRDQALREILERKERLDREYRERQAQKQADAGVAPAPSGPKTKLHGLARKKKALADAGPEAAAPRQTEPQVAPEPTTQVAPEPTTMEDELVEEALVGIKGVGPAIRKALMSRFDSVQAIRDADTAELTEVNGIGPALASRIKASL